MRSPISLASARFPRNAALKCLGFNAMTENETFSDKDTASGQRPL